MTTPDAARSMTRRPIDASTMVLGIETSCDETAAAVVLGGTDVLSSVVASQLDQHARFGGVVPEIASRAHVEALPHVTARALDQARVDYSRIDAVAATVGPGLVGALLVGVAAAKATALALDVPFVGVNHLEAHLYAALLDAPDAEFPMLFVLVSGGHTLFVEMRDAHSYRVIGQTIDDAAGEAFDKVARFLGLGYPGGPEIDKAAQRGDDSAVAFPRAMLHDGLDVSFSGLKTAVINHVRANSGVSTDDVAASFHVRWSTCSCTRRAVPRRRSELVPSRSAAESRRILSCVARWLRPARKIPARWFWRRASFAPTTPR